MKETNTITMPRMQAVYLNEVKDKLMEEFGYKNRMEIPKMQKIAVNVGMGESLTNKNAIESMLGDLTLASWGTLGRSWDTLKSLLGFH